MLIETKGSTEICLDYGIADSVLQAQRSGTTQVHDVGTNSETRSKTR